MIDGWRRLFLALLGVGRTRCAGAAGDGAADAVRVRVAVIDETPCRALAGLEEGGC